MSRPWPRISALKRVAASLAILAICASSAVAQPALTLESRADISAPKLEARAKFGGISGLDYDAARRRWFLISDDTAQRGPSRFYTASIRFHATPRVKVRDLRPLTDTAGRDFPAQGSGAESVDSEAMRIDPRDGSLIWSSEGDARDNFGPAIRRSTRSGREIARIALPAMFQRDPEQKRGPRTNNGFEGMDMAPDGGVWLAMEAPLIQDGPVPTPDAGAMTRIVRLDPEGAVVAQYAYPVDRIARATAGKNSDNGVSEMLAIDDTHVLMLERSGLQIDGNHYGFSTRLYLADLTGATDVSRLDSLQSRGFTPATKTLLLDFDALGGAPIGNLEAMAWARRGGDPRGRIVLMTDNNFDADWPTQMLVLRVGP